MNRPAPRRRAHTGRLTITAFAFICGLLTVALALGVDPFGGGTFLASAMAESPATAGHATSEPEHATAAETTVTTHTADLATEPHVELAKDPVFQADPLQSLADALHKKERELNAREAELNKKEQYLETIRLENEQTLAKIEAVRKQMEAISAAADQQRAKELKKWIEIFQKMTPEKVAPMMAQLEPSFQLRLLGQMDAAKAAKILNVFPTDKAAELSSKLNH